MRSLLAMTVMLGVAGLARAEDPLTGSADFTWHSDAVGQEIHGRLVRKTPDGPAATKPTSKPALRPTVVYLENLSATRVGTASDEAIIDGFAAQGLSVVTLDYAHATDAIGPKLVADILKLREAITGKKPQLLADQQIDPNHLFFVPEGSSLKRDVEFARDGKRVLAMDIVYPVASKTPVPVIMEITCDNKDRMGSFSLLFCHDAILEGASMSGFATAMVDHPVPPPYKGLDDPMPQVMYRLKAAVRTLRAESTALGCSGKIGVIGFSRGGPMAAMLAVTNGRSDLDGDESAHAGVSDDVQAAMVHGNRYDYLDLMANDPMLPRFTKAWGPVEANREKWAAHGASSYLAGEVPTAIAPMYLNTSDAESPEYRDGLEKFDKRLGLLGVEHVYQVDTDGRGHKISTDPNTLTKVYEFFRKHLSS